MADQREATGPWTGAVLAGTGLASVVRIPLPGSRGLAVEFKPRIFTGGTAVVGVVFAIGGGIAGYWAGDKAGAEIYDWGSAGFSPLPRASLEEAR